MTQGPSDYRILAGRAADAHNDGQDVVITIKQGRITDVSHEASNTKPQASDLDYRNSTVMPGFIDIHVHGGAGEYVMSGTAEGLVHIAAHLASHGVTGFLSTTVTGAWEEQTQAVAVAASAMRSEENGQHGAAVLGVHLEGPYINATRKGAQPPEYVLVPDVEDLVLGVGDNLYALKVVTLAPEILGGFELIRFLSSRGIVSSIGHSDATYDQVSAGISAGATHVTHCFNAMRPMEGREPGVVGAALAREELVSELIWDNIHVHPANCRTLINAKTSAGVILISDGIPGAGMHEGYEFYLGEHLVVVKGGAARLATGTLAGSLLTLDTAVKNACEFCIKDRAAMSAYNAARSLNLDDRKGLIKPGYDADLVVLDPDGRVQHTLIAGNHVFSA